VFIDDFILIAKIEKLIQAAVKEMAENFEITKDGDLDEYLGVMVRKTERPKD